MFFKNLIPSLLVFLLFGCGLHIGQKPPPQRQIRIEGDTCIHQIPALVKNYVTANVPTQTEVFFNCLAHSLTKVQTYVHGDDRQYFSPDELRALFENKIVTPKKISDEFLHAAMIFKTSVVGGSANVVVQSELTRLLSVIETLKQIALDLQKKPYMLTLNPKVGLARLKRGDSIPPVDEAVQIFRSSATRLGNLLSASHQVSRFSDVENLLREFQKFSDSNNEIVNVNRLADWLDLWKAFKEFAVQPDDQTIAPEDWPQFMYQAASWYSLWVRYQYLRYEDTPFLRPSYDKVIVFLEDVRNLLGQIIRSQPQAIIDYQKFDHLFSALDRLDMLPQSTHTSAWQKTIRVLITKIFNSGETEPAGRSSNGLTHSTVYRLGAEIEKWASIQSLLNNFIVRPTDYGPLAQWFEDPLVRRSIQPADLSRIVESGTNSSAGDQAHFTSFFKLLSEIQPLFYNNQARILFLNPKKDLEEKTHAYSLNDLSWLNLLQMLIRLLYNGYAEDPSRKQDLSGLTRDEVQKFYLDFQPLGQDLQVFDPRNCLAGELRYLEGKIFTYASNGLSDDESSKTPDLLNFNQGVELLGFLISGGLTAKTFYADLITRETCGLADEKYKDIFKDPLVKLDCALDKMVPMIERYLPNMPSFLSYYQKLSVIERRNFLTILMGAVRNGQTQYPICPDCTEKSEIVSLIVLLQYVEAVFTRYDINADGFLDYSEVETAYPVYRGLIVKTAKQQGINISLDMMSYSAYLYILLYGKIPQNNDLKDLLYARVAFTKIDRTDLAKAIRAIVQQILEKNRAKYGVDTKSCEGQKLLNHQALITR